MKKMGLEAVLKNAHNLVNGLVLSESVFLVLGWKMRANPFPPLVDLT